MVINLKLVSTIMSIYCLISCIDDVNSSRILCVQVDGVRSQYSTIEPLLIELSKRGHNVTVINSFPQEKRLPNFVDIDTSKYVTKFVSKLDVQELHTRTIPKDPFYDIYGLSKFEGSTKFFDVPEVKKLLNSENEKFDLIISEFFNNDLALGFVNKFKAPLVAFSSLALLPWANPRFGNPDNPSYIPVVLSNDYTWRMNFFQRTYNTILLLFGKFMYYTYFNYKSEYYVRNNFGNEIPPLFEIGKNTSLILVNTHHSLHGSRPLVPAVIEVGGMHVRPQKKLPQDLEKFINESEHGVIYFCMGSMLRASTLPEEKRLDLIEVFSKLPQRVLWKWETETMPDKPSNVKLVKWMPQRDVLAHPNVKLFISHGGLLGTTEAVYSGVPIIGMPFYGDQGVNIEAVQAAGAGLRLDFKDLNKESLQKAIREILDNPKYKENANQLSERFRDRPQTPLETAVYWTEYVIRHKGAPHLRSAAVDLTWYQYLLLDVIAFLLVSFITIIAILYYTTKSMYRFIANLFSKPQKAKAKSKRKNE